MRKEHFLGNENKRKRVYLALVIQSKGEPLTKEQDSRNGEWQGRSAAPCPEACPAPAQREHLPPGVSSRDVGSSGGRSVLGQACRGEKRGDPRATTETLGGPAVRRATVAAWAGGVARGEGAGSLSLAARLGFTTQVNQRPCA